MSAGGVPYIKLDNTDEKPVTVIINQEVVKFYVEPVIENNIVLLPLRKIFESLDANVSWNDETKTATVVKGSDSIIIGINETKMMKNGEEITLDIAAKIVDGRLLVPIKAISEVLEYGVLWDKTNNQVIIESKKDIIVTGGASSTVQD